MANFNKMTLRSKKEKGVRTSAKRNKIIGVAAVVGLGGLMAWHVSLNPQPKKGLSDVNLANIEALAITEAFDYESIGCHKVPCVVIYNNWPTHSVKRTCYMKNNGQYLSCSEVKCGDYFQCDDK